MSNASRFKRGGQPGNRNALKHGLYARRRSLPPGDQSTEDTDSVPTRRRLSLSREIDFLRVHYRRLYMSGVHCHSPDELGDLVRNLSLCAVAITRLIMTEDFLANAAGNQVQYDQLDQVMDKFIEFKNKVHPPPPPKLKVPITDPELEAMNPGIHLLAFQCGMTIEQIARSFYPDLLKRRALKAAASPHLPQGDGGKSSPPPAKGAK